MLPPPAGTSPPVHSMYLYGGEGLWKLTYLAKHDNLPPKVHFIQMDCWLGICGAPPPCVGGAYALGPDSAPCGL